MWVKPPILRWHVICDDSEWLDHLRMIHGNLSHPLAPHHLPGFITAPGETDVLFRIMVFVVVAGIVMIGVFYFRLHALPEHKAHTAQKFQYHLVAVLALISLFTHNHIFWIAGLLLAFIPIPDFSTPVSGMARSLERMASRYNAEFGDRAAGRGAHFRNSDDRQGSRPHATSRRSGLMFELMLCSLFTVFPDYLFRRYEQGKRFGQEINLYSVWYELRWGLTTCLMLTLLLITLIFYYHPSTKSAIAYFRTVPLLPEGSGRVAEIYVDYCATVKAGQPIFKLDNSEEEAALEVARRRLAEIDAELEQAKIQLAASQGKIQEAQNSYQQALDELDVQTQLVERDVAARRTMEKLQLVADGRKGTLMAVEADSQVIATQISTLLPAQRARAEAELAEAQVKLDKTVIYAGVDGTVEQFALRKGDIVNPLMRPAGILVPADAGRRGIFAGFGQIEAQVMKLGMVGEITCVAQPLTIIPMIVTEVQELIAAGQVRGTDLLIDPAQISAAGNDHGFHGTALRRWFRQDTAGKPLHCQCLHQLSRPSRRRKHKHGAMGIFPRHRHRRPGACNDPAHPGNPSAVADSCAGRPLTNCIAATETGAIARAGQLSRLIGIIAK